MSSGLLIVSNIKTIRTSIATIAKSYVKNLYIHLNVPEYINPPLWSPEIARIYLESLHTAHDLDIRVLVSSLKFQDCNKIGQEIGFLFSDEQFPKVSSDIQEKYRIKSNPIYLNESCIYNLNPISDPLHQAYMCDTVVLGGTFDRIHVGHKILLTEAVLRACKRLVVGVTSEKMIKSKRLWELILPVEQRIKDVEEFLNDIDCSLQYEIVPIDDPFGPTQSDPNMDMIIVSSETLRGGQKVNEIRANKGLKPLEIHCIDMVELNTDHEQKEVKVSSSNTRLDLLGTRLRAPEDQPNISWFTAFSRRIIPRPNLPPAPYIIGLSGGIASGKSVMVDRFKKMGAFILDCDKLAHELYEPGQICYKKIIEHFGEAILNEDGKINRQKLGTIVFKDPKELETLENIIWPELLLEAKSRINEAYEKNKFPVAILEAAILLKAGWDKECHEIWSMIVDPKEQIRRLKERNKLTEEEAQIRLSAQMDNKTIVNRSHVIFSSEWSYEFSQQQAERAWNMLMKELKNR